jgi:hypothetical protein
MTVLADLLLDQSLLLAPKELTAAAAAAEPACQQAADAGGHKAKELLPASVQESGISSSSSVEKPATTGEALLLLNVPQQPATAAGAESAAEVLRGRVQPLHVLLLSLPDALLPPVGGPTSATGRFRSSNSSNLELVLAGMKAVQQISSSSSTTEGAAGQGNTAPVPHLSGEDDSAARAARTSSTQQQQQQQGGCRVADAVLLRSRHAAVSWLREASRLGSAEAAAALAWMWQRGDVLQRDPDLAQQAILR